MAHRETKRTAFSLRGLAEFLLFCVALGLLIALHSTTISYILTSLSLGFLAISSIVILWRAWKHPDEFKRRGMGQASVLPRRWRKWMLDEDDKDPSR